MSSFLKSRSRTTWILIAVGVVLVLHLLSYGGALDNDFHDIDDHRHLANGAGMAFPNGYFRPGQEWSFRILYSLFGAWALPYHVVGQLFHVLTSLLFLGLVTRLLYCRWRGLMAGAVFVCLFGPSQAVLWIGAHLGVQSMFFVMLALHAWLSWLRRPAWPSLLAALAAVALGMGFKEDGLDVLPMMVLMAWYEGQLRSLVTTRKALALAPFVVLAALVTWRGLSGAGGVGLAVTSPDLGQIFDRLLVSLGHMPLPLNFRIHRPGMPVLGVLLLVAPIVLAYVARQRGDRSVATTLLAVGFLLAGHCAVVPVSPPAIGLRSYYAAAPGLALLLSVSLWQLGLLLPPRRIPQAIPLVLLLGWLAVNVMAIRRVEDWKYDSWSRHVTAVTEATRTVMEAPHERTSLLFLDPPMKDTRDFDCMLYAVLGVARGRSEIVWLLPDSPSLKEQASGSAGDEVLRWDAAMASWVAFDPGGKTWLDAWKPRWWMTELDLPGVSKKLRMVRVRLR